METNREEDVQNIMVDSDSLNYPQSMLQEQSFTQETQTMSEKIHKQSIDSDQSKTNGFQEGIIYKIELSSPSCPQCSKNNDEEEIRLINYKNSYKCCQTCGCLVLI